MSPTSDDTLLLSAWQDSGDAEAFRILCERYVGLIETACRRHGSPDTREAVQAVVLVLARRAGSVSGTNLGGWLTTTANRVVKDQHRDAARRRRHEQEAAVEQARQRAADGADPSWDEARQHLDAALASLSAGRREAILRFYLAGRPQAEVAAELGCSVAAVKIRVHEGLERLRAFYARKGIALGAVALASGLASEATASEPALVATCVQTVLTPAAAPGAAALAHGVVTAMIIKTATLAAAGLVLAGSCVTAALVVDAEPAPTPVAVPAAPTPVPATSIDIMDNIYQGISKEPDPLLKKAQDFIRKDTPQATVRPVQSANMHLGATLLMPQVVTKYRYYATILKETTSAPVRKFLAVSQDGEAAFVELAKVADHFGQQDRNAWKDEDYVNAARLYVHMTSVANEDGWKLLSKPDDFKAIEFNMRSLREQQHRAAQQIKPPTVTRRVEQKPDVAVTFYSWHLIGGGLKKWTVTFAATVSGSSENLGNFGGGGYD